MKEVKSFVIKRSEWLHGEGGTRSRLIRPTDNKKCCLGIWLTACGVPRQEILDEPSPGYSKIFPRESIPAWTVNPNYSTSNNQSRNSQIVINLMQWNDEVQTDDFTREQWIIKYFAQVGISVRFE